MDPLAAFNKLLRDLDIPIQAESLSLCLPALLLSAFESIVRQRVVQLSAGVRDSSDDLDKHQIIAVLIRQLAEHDVLDDDVDIDRVCQGDEHEVATLTTALVRLHSALQRPLSVTSNRSFLEEYKATSRALSPPPTPSSKSTLALLERTSVKKTTSARPTARLLDELDKMPSLKFSKGANARVTQALPETPTKSSATRPIESMVRSQPDEQKQRRQQESRQEARLLRRATNQGNLSSYGMSEIESFESKTRSTNGLLPREGASTSTATMKQPSILVQEKQETPPSDDDENDPYLVRLRQIKEQLAAKLEFLEKDSLRHTDLH